jgi:hypothetical protein
VPTQTPPTRWIDPQRLHSADTREIHKCSVIRHRPVAEQAREQCQGVVGQGRIDERFLPVERFCCATAWEAVVIGTRPNGFGKELGHRTQPESVPSVPSIVWREGRVSLICLCRTMLTVDIPVSVGESVVRDQFVFADLSPATVCATPSSQ